MSIPIITCENLRAGYQGEEILHNLSLNFQRGKITSLIGPNGCGKTTLLRVLSGFLPPMSGNVSLQGKPLLSWPRREFAQRVAVLPQNRDIPAVTARQFVAHGRYPHLSLSRRLTDKDRDILDKALEETDCLAFADKPLSELSGGQRQRVYFAMTLAQDTDILLLDEPTTYLDVAQKYELLRLVQKVNRSGKTVIMVLHDLNLAFSHSQQILLLDKGTLAASGPAQEVFESTTLSQVFHVRTATVEINGRKEYFFQG